LLLLGRTPGSSGVTYNYELQPTISGVTSTTIETGGPPDTWTTFYNWQFDVNYVLTGVVYNDAGGGVSLSGASPNLSAGYAWVPLAPMANSALQAAKQLANGRPTATLSRVLQEVPGTAPEIPLEDQEMADIIKALASWLRGGGLNPPGAPLPPSTVFLPIVSPCAIPSFQNTQMCGGNSY
jgi:hypothetical protein